MLYTKVGSLFAYVFIPERIYYSHSTSFVDFWIILKIYIIFKFTRMENAVLYMFSFGQNQWEQQFTISTYILNSFF